MTLQNVDYLVENHSFDNVDHFLGNAVVDRSFDNFAYVLR